MKISGKLWSCDNMDILIYDISYRVNFGYVDCKTETYYSIDVGV